MKKRLQICALLLAAALLCACQPTPSEDIVVNKGEADWQSESEPADTAAYDAPAAWSETIENGDTTYRIDATIEVPNVSKYPVIEVNPPISIIPCWILLCSKLCQMAFYA